MENNEQQPTDICRDENFEKHFPSVEWNTPPKLANAFTFWEDWWDAETWILWHSKVKEKYGRERANEVLIEWFKKAPILSPTLDYRHFSDKFIKYAKDNGFYDQLFFGLLDTTVKAATQVKEGATKVIGAAGNVAEKSGEVIGSIGKNFKWILLLALVIVVVYLFRDKIFK